MAFLENLAYLGFGTLSIIAIIPIIGNQRTHMQLTQAKLKKRLELGTPRNDLIEGLLERGKDANLDMQRLEIWITVLCIAGSETTGTLLCGVTYLLLTNRDALKRCSDEVRSTFQEESQITISSVKNLSYMLACLDEAMRCYPPMPNALHRMTPRGGCIIADHHVPQGTDFTIYQYAQNYSEKYWPHPYAFQPERFLKDEKSSGNRTEAMQPFLDRPHDCIGRTLMTILARIRFNFDMTLVDKDPHWIDRHKVFTFWIKPSLNVHLYSRI